MTNRGSGSGPNVSPSEPLPSSRDLLREARQGNSRALSALFRREAALLARWAHGRLPHWARHVLDTVDVVQDALLHTFRRLDQFEDRGHGALRAYLRQAIDNRIRDELRRIDRRPVSALLDEEFPASSASPLDAAIEAERMARYMRALHDLNEGDRQLIVARVELGYTYEQLALISGRSSAEAARKALQRAVVKLVASMSDE